MNEQELIRKLNLLEILYLVFPLGTFVFFVVVCLKTVDRNKAKRASKMRRLNEHPYKNLITLVIVTQKEG